MRTKKLIFVVYSTVEHVDVNHGDDTHECAMKEVTLVGSSPEIMIIEVKLKEHIEHLCQLNSVVKLTEEYKKECSSLREEQRSRPRGGERVVHSRNLEYQGLTQ